MKQGFWYCALVRFHTIDLCRIQSHNQQKNRIIAQCGENGQFCKMYSNSNVVFDKNYSSILKFSSSNVIFTWCKYCSAVGRCILKLYGIFLCFTTFTAQLNAVDFDGACNILWYRRPGNELDLLATWQDTRWRRVLARSFLIQIFLHLCKKPEDYWVDGTFTKP